MFYFYTNELHFAPEFLGRSQLVGSLASWEPMRNQILLLLHAGLAGIVLYNRRSLGNVMKVELILK